MTFCVIKEPFIKDGHVTAPPPPSIVLTPNSPDLERADKSCQRSATVVAYSQYIIFFSIGKQIGRGNTSAVEFSHWILKRREDGLTWFLFFSVLSHCETVEPAVRSEVRPWAPLVYVYWVPGEDI